MCRFILTLICLKRPLIKIFLNCGHIELNKKCKFSQILQLMAKVKYYYDTKTLSYKKIERTKLNMLGRILLFISSSSAIALCLVLLFFTLFDSPNVKEL